MLTLELDVHDGPDVLVRVLTMLRRRRCEIAHVDYLASAGWSSRSSLHPRTRTAWRRGWRTSSTSWTSRRW
jgi:hypothetical protein